jgi:hypothetical protein
MVYEDPPQVEYPVGGSPLWWFYRWSYHISPVWLAVLLALLTLCLFYVAAKSEELPVKCPAPPPGSPATCKVLTLTPLEEQALMGERGILDTAEQGRPLDLTAVVKYFRKKIQEAASGQPAENSKTEGKR